MDGRGGAPGSAGGGAPGSGATWCTKSRRPLFLRSLCTNSPAFFRPWPTPTWCTKSRRPLFFHSLYTKSHAFLRPWPAPTWCTKSRQSLYLRFLCTKSPAFFRPWPTPTWCTKSRQPLYLRFLCTKSRAFLRPCPGGRGASPLASPCFFVLRHHAPEHSSRSRRAGVVPHRSLALVSSSWGTTSPSTAAVPAGRAWCLTAR